MMPDTARRGLLGLAFAALFAAGAAAQPAFPARPLTIMVGFAPGGPSDVVARLLAPGMSADLGQPILVENLPGAGGTIAQARFAQGAPDGHTLLMGSIGQATVPTLYRRLSFDPVGSMRPVGLVNEVPMTVIVRRTLPAQTLAEFVGMARQNRERINLGNAGVGSTSHLCSLLLLSALETPLTLVPYRGSALVLNDLVAGTLDVGCDQSTNTAAQIRGGSVRALAVTTAARVEALPDLPTSAEGGLPALQMSGWNMMYVQAATPDAVVARLHRALRAALADPAVARRLAELGAPPVPAERGTPEASFAHWQAEIARWRPLILAAEAFAD
jgi:tripartite-type tricarboxylate transporter receptor subunit TctC